MPGSSTPGWLRPGTKVGQHYVVGKRIGGGSMAQVYRGEHSTLGRPVAIKVLDQDIADEPQVARRFLREAHAASRIKQENVVEVTDFGTLDDGRPFMVMEFLEGETLATTLRRDGPLPWERACTMLLQVLAALQAAHDQGVVHRDIKPGNIFRISWMGSEDFIKVFDFGVAKIRHGDGRPMTQLTLDGQLLGTPVYMAPEQCLTRSVDARADLYATGIIAYEMLTGRPPFLDTREVLILIYNQVNTPVPEMSKVAPNVSIPPGVEDLIRRALEKDPDDRYATAQEFAEAMLQVGGTDEEPKGLLPTLRGLFRRKK